MLGDSLNGKIDEGLAQTRFGVVILSPAFLMINTGQRKSYRGSVQETKRDVKVVNRSCANG